MTRFIDDRCLSNFMAIYDHGNLRRAAEKVGLTQPAMSKSLARLESDLGALLFLRRNRGLVPTEAAHELYACGSRIETDVRRSLVRLSKLDANVRGKLRLGAGPMWSWTRLPGMIHRLMGEFPSLQVDLITAPMKTLVGHLKDGAIDVAIGDMSDITVPHDCSKFCFEPIRQWPFFRQGHVLAQSRNLTLAEIVEYPWIGFLGDEVFMKNVLHTCQASGVPLPEIALRATSMAAGMVFARESDSVIILPETLDDSASSFQVVPARSTELVTWDLQTAAVFHKDEHILAPVRRLIDLMV